MFIKMFRSFTIFCLLAIICASGFIILNNAHGDGKGERCQGSVWTDWDPSCGGHPKSTCSSKKGTAIAKSTKKCVKGSSSDYCEMSQTSVTNGSAFCKWNQKAKTCENPSNVGSVQKPNC